MRDLFITGSAFLLGDIETGAFEPYVEARKLRRMEKIAKNVLWCAFSACQQAKIEFQKENNLGLSLAIGAGSLESTLRFLDSIIEDGDELSSPTAFAGSVHNSTALTLSLFLHSHGPCVTTGQLDGSFAAAFLTAQQFLASGMCEQVLVAATDDINPVAASLVPQNSNLWKGLIRPGEFQRAAAAFVLSNTPREKCLKVKHFSFTRTDVQESKPALDSFSSPAFCAVCTAQQCAVGKDFMIKDVFAGTDFKLEASVYAFEK
ncbi:MAG: beta-ketoacyl synthase chain length factor [Elusimicrobiaceae bacterium]|nr:beta-ketoacyl synthase chain length factor [Elusimicrobiaceae bacterium]